MNQKTLGSFFITDVVEIFKEHAHDTELLTLFKMVKEKRIKLT